MAQSQTGRTLDFCSPIYRDAFSRINGIVIEGDRNE